ncbi:MAG: M20/M25/M40 family metallo-hydrolase [Sporomusaceae bacterium]|nr:M20/M25/M40 family metallo-hydrolase [Sporomusaceae bacterium]
MNKDRMLQEFFDLVKLPCSTGKERQAADFVTEKLKALGCTVTEDQAGEQFGGNTGNVIALLPGTKQGVPTVMLTAHLDCVEPCSGIEPVLADGVIRSAGNTILGSDDKAGVAAILEGLRSLQEAKLDHGDVLIVFTVAEEGGLKGARHIDKTLLAKADFGYALDGGGPVGEIITAAPGQDQIDVTIYGKTAHAGLAPESGLNAIVLAGKALAAIEQGRIDAETTANIGKISGGVATNIVPDQVEIKCEARSRNSEKLAKQVAHMKETFITVAQAGGGRAEVKVERAYDAFVLADDAPVVEIAVTAAKALALEPKLGATGGGSDANYFNVYGVPCVVLGVGMSKVHTTEEFIETTELFLAADYVKALIEAAATTPWNGK